MEGMKKSVKQGKQDWDDGNIITGTIQYDSYPTFEEWDAQFEGYCGMGSVTTDRYYSKLPVWAKGNVYFNDAKPMKKESDAYVDKKNKVTIGVKNVDGKVTIETNLYDFMPDAKCSLIHTDDINPAFEPEQKYENPDGTPITFDTDFYDVKRDSAPIAGPFANKEELSNPLFNFTY